jgi:hypothetical protein
VPRKKKEVHGDWLSAYAFSVFEYRVAWLVMSTDS